MQRRRRATGIHARDAGGFTFLEVLVVMALLAILMGIGVGYLSNIKAGAGAAQSLAVLRETAAACKTSSNGGTRAIFDLQRDPNDDALYVGAAIARPVLTHNFERLDVVSRDYPVDIKGRVEVTPAGYTGNAGSFGRGGSLELAAQSSFAMTEGLSLAVWLRPEAEGAKRMTIVKGEGAYEVLLLKDQGENTYDVMLKLNLRDADEARSVVQPKEFRTKGGVVPADGRQWTHLRVVYDGSDASIRVGGFEHYRKRKASREVTPSEDAPQASRQVIAIPEGGAVRLVISDPNSSYLGAMDQLVLGGVFRSSEGNRKLTGLRLLRPNAPLRIVWRNGRLDPDVHGSDVVLLFQEEAGRAENVPIEMRFGLYGLVTQRAASYAAGDAP